MMGKPKLQTKQDQFIQNPEKKHVESFAKC